jgi:hypothetical protein
VAAGIKADIKAEVKLEEGREVRVEKINRHTQRG